MDAMAIVSDLTSFGAAGLMAALWLWERRLSRRREEQLTEAHGRIVRDEQRLEQLTGVVERNTAAITRLTENQREHFEVLRHLMEELNHARIR